MKFSLPVYQANGQPYKSADDLLKLLARETMGTFLVGKSNFWHGGIHITDKIASHCVKNDMVRCMADGTVVAYRLNADYLQSQWMGDSLKYSNGFVLVRHDYKSPANTEEGPNKGKKNELTFYSLYMHVAPFSAYETAPLRPLYKITATQLKTRVEASLSAAEIGIIDSGATIEVLDTREVENGGNRYVFANAILKSGKIRKSGSDAKQGTNPFWVAISQLAPATKAFATLQEQKQPQPRLPTYLSGKVIAKTNRVINARTDDSGTDSSIHAVLPAGTLLEFERAKEKTITVGGTRYRFAPCHISECALEGWRDWPKPLWVCVEDKFISVTGLKVEPLDQVVACNVPIRAGDPVAHLGLYESTQSLVGGKNSKHLVHVEMFSFDPGLDSFLKNSAGMSQCGKYLRLEKGMKLCGKAETAEAVEFAEADKALERMTVIPRSALKKHKDKDGKVWLEVSVDDKSGQQKGFVAEEGVNFVSQHDLMELGFQTVTAPDSFDGYLAKDGVHPFFKDLHQKIADEPAPEDRDKIRAALTCKENCSVWSKVIARHPSEWKHRSGHSSWSILDSLLKTAPELLDHEKQRIDKCVWWDEVADKVPGFDRSGVVWHFHPVGFAGQMLSRFDWPLNADLVRKIFSDADHKNDRINLFLDEIVSQVNQCFELYKLDSNLRMAHFFAQILIEVGPSFEVEEGFNYSVPALKALFRYFRNNPAEADQYGYIRDIGTRQYLQRADEMAIANRAYAGRESNGDVTSGDGWKFRGRGLKQLTFRSNYRAFTQWNKLFFSENIDFEIEPDRLLEAKYAVRSAAFFWESNKLYRIADLGSARAVVNKVTDVVNVHTDSRDRRCVSFERIYKDDVLSKVF